MQLLIAFTCGLICFSAVFAASPTPEELKFMKETMDGCIEKTGVNLDVLKKLKEGEKIDDENVDCFNACVMQVMGIMDDAGDLHPEVAKEKIPDDMKQKTAEIIELCSKEKGDNPCATAGLVFKCLHENKAEELFHGSHE